ncbi:MAG: hypothetical protein LBF28_01840 [Rickettsiales bacterium]|nr:hypothetical protein [Rickettsiales bacterium]
MKKFLRICLAVFIIALNRNNAFAALCPVVSCDDVIVPTIQGCSSYTCYNSGYASCNTCNSGYTRINDGSSYTGSCTFTYYYCNNDCTGCSDCTGDADWSAHSTGYQKKVTRSCNCNTCSSSTSYRCAAGYYGSSATGTSGCSPCPTGGTNNAGATAVTECYASTTSGTDATGSWEYDQTCYYSETE